eukprot:SAG31_NODE_37418_length_304_cov_1.000000_1_plen_27_part_01
MVAWCRIDTGRDTRRELILQLFVVVVV